MTKSEHVRKLIVAAVEKKTPKSELTLQVMKVTGFGTSLANLYIKNNRSRALKDRANAAKRARRAATKQTVAA